jgi:hypothetical protein
MRTTLVDKITKCTLPFFRSHYFDKNTPCIIKGAMENWPLYKHVNHDINNLKTSKFTKNHGHVFVPVEHGSYTSQDFKQIHMTLAEYINKIIIPNDNSNTLYLAQHGIFDQIPELRTEIITPEYCYAGLGDQYNTNFWLGPAHTKTPLHKDPNHNIFCQVVGKKYVRLYPADVPTTAIFPFPTFTRRNTSQVDVECVDPKFSAFNTLDCFECEVEGGDMLFIPLGFWHFVKSVERSLSVNFWFR